MVHLGKFRVATLAKAWVLPFSLVALSGCVTVESPGTGKVSDEATQTATSIGSGPVEGKTPHQPDWNKAAKERMSLGLQYLEQGNTARAKANLDKAMKYRPDMPEVQYGMGYYYQRVNEPKIAEEHYKKALSLAPKDADAHNIYGAFLCAQGRYDEAQDHFDTAVSSPNYSQQAATLENAGLCSLKQGDKAKAEGYFNKALGYNPEQPRALLELGNMEFDRGNLARARGYLSSYQKVARPNPRSLWLSIRIAREVGDKDTEASSALLLTQQFPQSDEAKLYQQSRASWQR